MDAELLRKALAEREHPRASVVAAIGRLGLVDGMRVLDAGCGPGAHLALFARAVAPGGRVTGLDVDAERMAVAGEVCREEVASGVVELREGDLHGLPFADGTFDVAWSALATHHVERPVEALRELRRVTRPGGTVAILEGDDDGSFPILPWPPEFEGRLRAAALRAHQENYGGTLGHHYGGYTGRALPRLLREAGLEGARIETVADIDRAPLDERRKDEIREWFGGPFARRVRDYLAPADMQRLLAYVDPEAPEYLLDDPDFFQARTSFLATCRV